MSESQGWELKNPWGSVLLMEKQRGGFSITLKAGKFNISSLTLLLNFLNKTTVEELFAYIFGIYKKFGGNNPSILAPSDSVDVAT